MRDAEARSTMLAIAAGYEKLARRVEIAKAVAPASTDIYRSSNGDRWRLISDPVSGRRFVRHEANLASGGHVIEIEVEEFLAVNGPGPEYRGFAANPRQQPGASPRDRSLTWTTRPGPGCPPARISSAAGDSLH